MRVYSRGAGRLRHRLRIETAVQVGVGIPSLEWPEVAVVRGSVEDLRGEELMAAMAIASRITTRVRIRYRTGLTSKHRFVVIHTDAAGATVEDRILNINTVLDPSGRRRELEVLCTEGE